uniref:Uncharacterized protein n=1 Tax=viral metagenome TaxID=1070528 RepID=A0A6C0H9J1_9ZZZZ
MLFRSDTGLMVIINKYDYKNDDLYYKKIKNIKFSKNNVLNSSQNATNYSNSLIFNLLKRSGNDLDNQE